MWEKQIGIAEGTRVDGIAEGLNVVGIKVGFHVVGVREGIYVGIADGCIGLCVGITEGFIEEGINMLVGDKVDLEVGIFVEMTAGTFFGGDWQ